jgi:opacity protein-like surface antigen
MNGRSFSLFLVLLVSVPMVAQQARNEVAVSAGRSDMGELGDAPAFGVSYNRYWTGGLSTRFEVFTAGEENGVGDRRVTTSHISAEYHFLRDRAVSPYVGAGLAWVDNTRHLDEFDFTSTESVFTAIGSAGVDLNVSRRFSLGVDVRYLYFDVELGSRFGYQVDPLTVMGSAKFRF